MVKPLYSAFVLEGEIFQWIGRHQSSSMSSYLWKQAQRASATASQAW
jgi:hypothetical protein